MHPFNPRFSRVQRAAPKDLLLREWAAIALFFSFSATLLFASHFSQVRDSRWLKEIVCEVTQPLEITVSGEVKAPGVYLVEPGSTLKDLLKSCPLKKSADRKQIPMKKVLYSSQMICIAKK